MLSEEAIIINKIAQNKMSIDKGIKWFERGNIDFQKSIVFITKFYLEQSNPNQILINESIQFIPLNQKCKPVSIFKTMTFKNATLAVNDLPDQELKNSFITLITLFKHTDTHRRNTLCKQGCDHEWHNLKESTQKRNGLIVRVRDFFRRGSN